MLGLALVGTTSGILLGQHLQKKALAAQSVAITQRKLLSDLQVKILYNRPTKQLSPYLSHWNSLHTAGHLMLSRVEEIAELLKHRESIYTAKRQLSIQRGDPREEELQQLFDNYEQDLIQFETRLQQFLQSVEPIDNAGIDLRKAQALLIAFVQGPEFADFVRLPKDLVPFVSYVESQERLASEALSRAIALQTQIIFGSLLLSVAIAALIAGYTSRTLSSPIQTVTQITHRITQENDFSLQVPILGEGAVATLATSFNQLITQVNQLLSEVRQKKAELEAALTKLQQQQHHLVRAEKMSSLGQLVAGIAHEINNPVSFIHGNLKHVDQYTQSLLDMLNLYQAEYPEPSRRLRDEIEDLDLCFVKEDLPKLLSSMKTGTQRIRDIVISLRSFSRIDQSTFKPVDIHEGIESTLLILHHRLVGKNGIPMIAVTRDYDQLPPITCSAGELNQVFMNILVNAIDALRAKNQRSDTLLPKITIRTSKLQTDWVQIEMTDNGPGMSTALKSQIFEPFFTTKPVGKGTGMGLSLCYQIITDTHKGKLACLSSPERGTTLMIQIPCQPLAPLSIFLLFSQDLLSGSSAALRESHLCSSHDVHSARLCLLTICRPFIQMHSQQRLPKRASGDRYSTSL